MWRLLILIVVFISTSEGQFTKSDLLDSEWQNFFKAGGMHFGHGRNKRFVELNENQPNIPHQACLLPNGKVGHCRHLHYCIQEEFQKDFVKVMDYLCIINHSAIGVCCPDGMMASALDGLAGNLPATASKDENALSFRFDRPETRGCGLSTRAQSKVAGSQTAGPRDWPWMALISPEDFEDYFGGVLITDRHVLTAAHCTRKFKAIELFVRLGEYDRRRKNDTRSYDFRVIEKRQHDLFDKNNYQYDIAIVKLHRPAVFSTYVWPICLPPRGLELEGEVVTLIGWGTLMFGGPKSKVLMEVSIPVWNQKKCKKCFSATIFDEVLCAADMDKEGDSCQHDSGGPLMYQMLSGRWTVVGLVSWGISCGEPQHPGLYTRVDKYLEWILENSIF